jgi:hypothetical protein
VDLDAETPSERLAWLDALLASHSYQLSGPLRDLLYTQARGHPLFSTELLQLWCERGWLVRGEDASWQERHTPDPMLVPIKVAAAIRRRIDCLSADAVRLLQAAGTEGETFTLPAVAAALGWSERRTLELIATELIHQHSLVAEADGSEESVPMSFRFAVPMLRTYLNSQLDNWERRLLLGRMGDASGTRSGALRGRKPATL